jgi:hypothetical protein
MLCSLHLAVNDGVAIIKRKFRWGQLVEIHDMNAWHRRSDISIDITETFHHAVNNHPHQLKLDQLIGTYLP